MADAPEEVASGGNASPFGRHPRAIVRGMADWLLAVGFFAVVALAALPMGANRDWAWAPIAVIVGILAVAAAAGIGVHSVFGYEHDRSTPLPETLERLAAALGVAVEELLSEGSAP